MPDWRIIVGIVVAIVALATVVVVLRRRSSLPPHLTPYFKSGAELDAFVEEQQKNDDRRREELTDPSNAKEASEYLTLNGYEVKNPTFEKALKMVEDNLKDYPGKYGQQLGEIYAFSQVYGNPEKAYYFYYIGLSQSGYKVAFKDDLDDPPAYHGPVGDFRNEPQVSEIVDRLGFEKVKKIDSEASKWLEDNGFEVKESEE